MKRTLRLILVATFISVSILSSAQSACPQVTIAPVPPICSGQCTNLTATVQGSVATTSYSVSNIPYAPYAYTGGNPVLVNIDDTWSSVVTMPFCFQFFGNTYNQFVIGSNALISFDLASYPAGSYCQWPISAAIPSNTNPLNSIMAPFHDIDPSVSTPTSATDINWAVYGTAPCRYMVVNWNDVAMFSCNNLIATSQLVLHETTNIIDIFIQNKPTCASWNGGAAIEGIQNATGTTAFFVAGRNFPTNWTAVNDGKRFTPSGAPQYTLNWTGPSGNLGSANPINVCPTTNSTYTCTVTNTTCAGNVVVSATVPVTVTAGLTLSGAQTNSTSCTACNGSATVTVVSGTGPFTYAWAPSGGASATAPNLCPGTYTCTVTGAGGCTGTQTFLITGPAPPTSTQSHTNVLCNGGSTGSATITPNPAGAYTYTWSPNVGSTATVNNLAAGTYTVTATNAGGCTTTQTITITQPAALTNAITVTNPLCNGGTGSLGCCAAGGGTGPYTYSWSPAGGPGCNSGPLFPGTYTCTTTDANGCIVTNSATITQPTAITATSSSTPATCGGNNGTVTANPSGGTGPYTYSWNTTPVQNTQTATGLATGTYTCTITDSHACTFTVSATVANTGGITASITSTTNVSCFGGSNGTLTGAPTGGTGPYTYAWTAAGGSNPTTTPLPAGTYTITITDANGCIGTATGTITQPTALTNSLTTTTNVLCNGGTGTLAACNASGGTPPYTYSWTGGGGTGCTTTPVPAGSYTCTTTDANGCTTTTTGTITQPTPLTASNTTTLASCGNNNGSATATGAGGVGPYSYSWNTNPVQNTQTASNIPAGSYTCTVTDANGCTITNVATVSNSGGPTTTMDPPTNVSCNAGTDGSASVTVVGGTNPLVYSWTSGGNAPAENNLAAGSYTCTVTDANGCISSASVVITEPPALTITGSSMNVDCFGNSTGSASVTVGGGTPSYTYSWSPAAGAGSTTTPSPAGNYTCTATDANGCSITQSFAITEPTQLTLAITGLSTLCSNTCDGEVIVIPSGGTSPYNFAWNTGCSNPSCNNLCVGSYTVDVTDANGCVANASTTITSPAPIVVNTSETDAHCNQADGTVSANANGGTGSLNYQWSNGGPASQNWNTVAANTYWCVVTDQNGCIDSASATVNNIAGVITAISNVSNISCNGACDGTITATASGGTGGLTYSWSGGGGNALTTSPLCAGTYTLTVSDAVGCSATASSTITEPPPLVANVSATPASVCAGQPITLNGPAAGGTAPYTYNWVPFGLTTASGTVVPTSSGAATQIVTDANGCVDSASVNITVDAIPVAALVGDSLQGCAPLCVNFSDLSTVSTGAITGWAWDFGDGNTSTSQNPSHCYSTPGPYSVSLTASTSSGCANTVVMTNYINVFANPVAAFTAGPQPTTELDATIFFTDASTNATSWMWSFGDTTGNATSTLQNPSYTYGGPGCFQVVLTVSSGNNCIDTATQMVYIDPDVTIFVPNAFTPDGDGVNETFFAQGIGIDPDHFDLWIFDRWGNLIFYTDDMSKGWDGKVQGHDNPCQIDTYVWKIKAIDVLGHKHNLIGKVSLIR